MFINRGNHETKDMNRTYGFEGEAKHKHGEQSYKVCLIGTLTVGPALNIMHFTSFLLISSPHVSCCERIHTTNIIVTFLLVPLATLVNATERPVLKKDSNAILSPQGFRRYFVVHGGLFSKDQVTLEDIRKIDRIGRQPGQEGLMCQFLCFACF